MSKQTETTVPKPPSIRQCSFDPAKHMSSYQYKEGSPFELYLDVKYRVLWFNIYCAENELVGVIDDSDAVFDPIAKMVIAKASIFINDKLVAKSMSSKPYDPNKPFDPNDPATSTVAFQTAATQAKGRALANAGFGTVNGQLEDGDPIPCDAGIKHDGSVVYNPRNPMYVKVSDGPAAETGEVTQASGKDAQPKGAAGSPKELTPTMTLAEAKAIQLPFGQYLGKTMGELLVLDKSLVAYYASDKFSNEKFPQLKVAATLICQEMNIAIK